MGWRYRKSIKIVPGVRLNVSRRGVGYSVGTRGFRVSHGADGRVRRTISIPGTGLSHVQTLGSTRSRSAGSRSAASARPAPVGAPKPGMLAPRGEKDLYAALFDHPDPARLMSELPRIGQQHADLRTLAAALHGLLCVSAGDSDRARDLLGWVFASGHELTQHPFVIKYMPAFSVNVEIAAGVGAELPLSREAVGLAVAELHQDAGDVPVALWTVEQLPMTTPVALSTADLLTEAGQFDDVVDLTDSLTNVDDLTALLCVLRGAALRELGFHDAAREALKEAMRIRSRAPQVRHRALLERALTYLAQNKRAMARKDLERILAEDSEYPGLTQALAQISA